MGTSKIFPVKFFIIVLDACNTSAEINIEGAEKDFTDIYFDDFPG